VAGMQSVKPTKRSIAKLLYFNARSILSKLDLLQSHVYDNKPDIIAVCESFTNSDIGDAHLGVEGYELISRKDGKDTTRGKCRGLLIYAKQGLQASQCTIPGEDTVTEMTSVKIPWGRGEEGNRNFCMLCWSIDHPGCLAVMGMGATQKDFTMFWEPYRGMW
jgi:hypothetical protein